MTNIEMETLSAVRAAARKYVNTTNGIDWEQRRYEIAKDVLSARLANPQSWSGANFDKENFVETCVEYAEILIKKLQA